MDENSIKTRKLNLANEALDWLSFNEEPEANSAVFWSEVDKKELCFWISELITKARHTWILINENPDKRFK